MTALFMRQRKGQIATPAESGLTPGAEMDDGLDDADFAVAFDAPPPQASTAPRPAARLDAPSRSAQQQSPAAKVQQPKPQTIEKRTGPSSILVSPRQKGNPVLASIRALPWEYSDIPADFVLGQTTCALFLSLKYHKLHPEYIYSRIRGLHGKYGLRIVLALVDITNHEEPLRELSKTSIINEVTVILCWSAQEAGRYLELYKSFEGAAPTSIRSHQSTTYSDRLVDFITVPRSINKADAVALVSSFGSVRTAVNARPEEMALVQGWGEKKVQRWCASVREPFRVKRAARKVMQQPVTAPEKPSRDNDDGIEQEMDPAVAARLGIATSVPLAAAKSSQPVVPETGPGPDEDEELALLEADVTSRPKVSAPASAKRKATSDADLSEGIAAHLERLRREGG